MPSDVMAEPRSWPACSRTRRRPLRSTLALALAPAALVTILTTLVACESKTEETCAGQIELTLTGEREAFAPRLVGTVNLEGQGTSPFVCKPGETTVTTAGKMFGVICDDVTDSVAHLELDLHVAKPRPKRLVLEFGVGGGEGRVEQEIEWQGDTCPGAELEVRVERRRSPFSDALIEATPEPHEPEEPESTGNSGNRTDAAE